MTSLPSWGALVGAALLVPLSAVAQEGQGGQTPPPPTPPGIEAELTFEREVFTYPTFTRRNPFKPLLANNTDGPRWETMRLEGIVFDADPRYSIAIVSSGRTMVGQQAQSADPNGTVGQMARLRTGERWGNIRIIEIRKDQILIQVEEFGLTEQRTMRLPVRGGGQGGLR